MPTDLADIERLARETPRHELAALAGALERAKAEVWARLMEAPTAPLGAAADENLSAKEAARRLGVSKDWMYEHADRLPFTVKIGRRVLFSAHGLEKWNRQRMGR